jgi:hypothetical protein
LERRSAIKGTEHVFAYSALGADIIVVKIGKGNIIVFGWIVDITTYITYIFLHKSLLV